ncbi:hypothetical protein Q4E93_29000 [Flavitalea sp. BT771]|uniref:hypothetical protein n=1 Tax=Flavitalea sp. BT771 TaxID=3063329 RepID=UPI0026E15F49|nr:hypothetical protein [Flavitalea sp. BT771]MDO6434684.1 hypothetical protein [Flavitalea sp. BT771]MDV6223584.1 hypothetical protein [Flavitalea sp. BT771]
MKKWQLPIILFAGCVLPGCFRSLPQQAYLTSALHGNANDYHPVPQVQDSAQRAFYVHGAFVSGSAGIQLKDRVTAFRGSFTAAHHGRFWQAYYGGDLTLGSYDIRKWDTATTATYQHPAPLYNAAILNRQAGGKFFGGVGLHGGANFTIPMGIAEWRIVGVETSLYREFGNYLTVRRKLPDTAASLIVRNPFYGTIGLSSEFVIKWPDGEFGWRISGGPVIGYPYSNPEIYDNASDSYLHYWYFSTSTHVTISRYTGYLQTNFAAKAFSIGMGLHYRLSEPRITRRSPAHRRYRSYNL